MKSPLRFCWLFNTLIDKVYPKFRLNKFSEALKIIDSLHNYYFFSKDDEAQLYKLESAELEKILVKAGSSPAI